MLLPSTLKDKDKIVLMTFSWAADRHVQIKIWWRMKKKKNLINSCNNERKE